MNATAEWSIKMPHEVNSAALSVNVCHAYNYTDVLVKLHTMEQTTSSGVLTVAGTEKLRAATTADVPPPLFSQ